VVSLRPLPAPDVRLFAWPEGHVSLLIDDGTPLLPALVRKLTAQAWPVVVFRPPDMIASDPAGVQDGCAESPDHSSDCQPTHDTPIVQLADWSEAAVIAARDQITKDYGPVAACVVLAPPALGAPSPTQTDEGAAGPNHRAGAHHRAGLNHRGDQDYSDLLGGLAARQGVRLAFLLAKHLHDQLTEVARRSWAGFFTVTRLDGMWGLTGSPRVLNPTSGLAGLTKTLRLEWPAVACRAVDLDPDLTPDAAAKFLMDELLDPNSALSEVGWGSEGRMTLDAVVGGVTAAGEERVDG
jgi:hypothetical protein